MSKIAGNFRSSSNTADVTPVVVVEEGGGLPLVEIGTVETLADHTAKGKEPEHPKPEVDVGQTVTIDLPEVAETVVAEQAEVKRQLTQREINLLTVTPAQDADHRAARLREKEKISYSVLYGVSGLGSTGGMIYGFVDERARSSGLGIGLAFGAAICLGVSAYYLYQVLKSKGIIPHTERNLR